MAEAAETRHCSISQSTASCAAADLVKIKIGDVVAGADVRTRAIVIQQKTNRPVQFELTSDVGATLLSWLERRCGSITDYLFSSRIDHALHMSTRQYARLVDEWVTAIGLRKSEYGTHSLRRTKAAMIYRATGNIRAIEILLGHTRSRIPFAISGLTSKTPCCWRSAPKSNLSCGRPSTSVDRFQASPKLRRMTTLRAESCHRSKAFDSASHFLHGRRDTVIFDKVDCLVHRVVSEFEVITHDDAICGVVRCLER